MRYLTQPGWAHDDSRFQWELHDQRGQVVVTITDEATRPLWDDSDVAEYPFARVFPCSITVTFKLAAEVLYGFHIAHGGWKSRKSLHRCQLCNPSGNPPPLPIDGREYHRRQQARKRRRAT
jgi:hypothetical protein